MKTLILLGFLVIFNFCVRSQAASLSADDYEHEVEDLHKDVDGNWIGADFDGELEPYDPEEESADTLSKRVLFYVYTQSNPRRRQQIWVGNDTALQNSNFDPRRPTRIVAHQWIQSEKGLFITIVRDAYLQHGDYNIIMVDWSDISRHVYTYSSSRVKLVGLWTARLIDYLETRGMDLKTTVLVGHSLGAHVVGLTGYQTTNKVGYIVGLDPAGPLFHTASAGSRIAKGDADFVQIIHTNGGILGMNRQIGDLDFYPNGGVKQAGCITDVAGVCSHLRAATFFSESINSDVGFWGTECSSYTAYKLLRCRRNGVALMGGSVLETSATGTYYFDTNWRSPFALGK